MFFINESDVIEKSKKLMKFLIGPWNSEASFDFAVGHLEPGQSSPYHFHVKVEEVLYIISGTLEVDVDGQITEMTPGTAAYIKPGLKHSVKAKTNVHLVEVKNPSDESDKHIVR